MFTIFKTASPGNALICLASCVLLFISSSLKSRSYEPGTEDLAGDALLQEQGDSILFQLNLNYLNGVNDNQTPFQLIPVLEEILKLDSTLYNHWFNLGLENIKIHEYEAAIEALNRGLRLYPIGDNPSLLQIYLSLSFSYHKTEKHNLEREVLDKASLFFPDDPDLTGRYAVCAHSRVRNTEADHYQKKVISILRSRSMNESDIAYYLGRLYLSTDYLEAEKHFRVALQYDPENTEKSAALAWVLIKNALKIDEGMELIEQAIQADPYNAVYLHQQGYGYFIKGDYQAALTNLYKARDLYREYSFELDKHIAMVEEAIAGPQE